MVALQLAAPVIRSLYIEVYDRGVREDVRRDTGGGVVVPVVLVVLVLAVPPMVSQLPKTSTGPSGLGMTPTGGSVGIVEGLVVNGNG